MYDQLKHSITRLNDISGIILNELKTETPRLELIQSEFENRKEYLEVLGVFQQKTKGNTVNLDKDKLGALRPLFDAFISINDEIKSKMATLKDQQIETLARARKQRKVQESYSVVRTPNIHHF